MSKLSEYVEKIKQYKEQNPDISETKLIRYVYLDLGQRFSFDLNFSFGNTKTKQKIYSRGRTEEQLNEAMESNTIICKSVSYILEYILKQVGVDITTEVEPNDRRKCPHMYNIVNPKEGKSYIIDLQEDIENIQSHSFTTNFGLSVDRSEPPVISRFEIEQMDRELGYIDDEHYYSDDYLYLLKSAMGYFKDFSEKVEFVLGNIDIYTNRKIQYAERQWKHEEILAELFSPEELVKMRIIDCYQGDGEEREYKNCIAVDNKGATEIYMYSVEENRYCKMSIMEFAKMTQNGLVPLQGVPGLRKAIRRLKEDKDDLDN